MLFLHDFTIEQVSTFWNLHYFGLSCINNVCRIATSIEEFGKFERLRQLALNMQMPMDHVNAYKAM